MRKIVPFSIGVWVHLEAGESVDDVKGYDVTIISADTLSAAHFHRSIVHFIAVCFELTGRVDGVLNDMMGALTEHTEDRTTLRDELGCRIDNLESIKLMIVNTSNVDGTGMNMTDNSIITNDAAVGTTIHEKTTFLSTVSTDHAATPCGVGITCFRRHHTFGLIRCPGRHGCDSIVSEGLIVRQSQSDLAFQKSGCGGGDGAG